MGQAHVHEWLGELLPIIEKGLLKLEEIVTHYSRLTKRHATTKFSKNVKKSAGRPS